MITKVPIMILLSNQNVLNIFIASSIEANYDTQCYVIYTKYPKIKKKGAEGKEQ
jgi:hypothetical protein